MIATCIIACLAILLTFLCLLLFPVITIKGHQFSTFYFPSLIALIILLATGLLPIQDYLSNLVKDTTMNPLEILALFFGTAFISTVLDELGFFSFLAKAFSTGVLTPAFLPILGVSFLENSLYFSSVLFLISSSKSAYDIFLSPI